MDIQIPHNSTKLHLAPCMRIVFCVCRLGPSHTSKQNFLSLILLIPFAKLMNQNNSICRHHIFYPLWLGPPFPNNGSTLKPKVGLEPNLMKIDLRKVFVENITYFWRNNFFFWKRTATRNPRVCACIHTYLYTHLSHTYAHPYMGMCT